MPDDTDESPGLITQGVLGVLGLFAGRAPTPYPTATPARSLPLLPFHIPTPRGKGGDAFQAFFDNHDIVALAKHRSRVLGGSAWPEIDDPVPGSGAKGVVDALTIYMNKLLKSPTPIAPLLQLWRAGCGTFEWQDAEKKQSTDCCFSIGDGAYALESRLNHDQFNHRGRSLVTLPGEFIVMHGQRGVAVRDSGLVHNDPARFSQDYRLTLGPTSSGRCAEYVLVSCVCREQDGAIQYYPLHWSNRELRMSQKSKAGKHNPAVEGWTLLLTLWRRPPESATAPPVVRERRERAPQRHQRELSPTPAERRQRHNELVKQGFEPYLPEDEEEKKGP